MKRAAAYQRSGGRHLGDVEERDGGAALRIASLACGQPCARRRTARTRAHGALRPYACATCPLLHDRLMRAVGSAMAYAGALAAGVLPRTVAVPALWRWQSALLAAVQRRKFW